MLETIIQTNEFKKGDLLVLNFKVPPIVGFEDDEEFAERVAAISSNIDKLKEFAHKYQGFIDDDYALIFGVFTITKLNI